MKRLIFLIAWLYAYMAAAQTSNLPSSMGTFTVFKEAPLPVTIIMPEGYDIQSPIVEIWNNNKKLSDSTQVLVSGDTLKFTLAKQQLAPLSRNPYFFIKLKGDYVLGALLNPTIGIGVPTNVTKSVSLPSTGTVRVSVVGDAAAAMQAASQVKTELLSLQQLVSQGFRVKGNWDVPANNPNLSSISKVSGDAYVVSVPGSTSITGTSVSASKGDVFNWNGTQWIYRASALVPAEGTVSYDKTDMFTSGRNLFNINDPSNIIGSYIHDVTGSQISSANHNTTHFIPMSAGQTFIVSSTITGNIRILYYNSSNAFLSGYVGPAVARVAPANTAFIRVSVNTSDTPWAKLQVEFGATKNDWRKFQKILATSKDIPIVASEALVAEKAGEASTLAPAARLSADQINYTKSKNLFNISDAGNLIGSYINNATGGVVASVNHNTTHAIPITAGQSFVVSSTTMGNVRIIYYNASNAFLSGYIGTSMPQIAPANTAYLKVSINITDASWEKLQVELGSAKTDYEPHGWYVTPISGSPVISKSIDPKSVLTSGNLSYSRSKNLFNPSDPDVALLFYVNSLTGNLVSSPLYNTTGFIPVKPSTAYTMTYKNQIAWYTASKVYISGSTNADQNKTQTSPANAAYIRTMVSLAEWDRYQFEEGTASTEYNPYGFILDKIEGLPVWSKRKVPDPVVVVEGPTYTAPVLAPKYYLPRQKELSIYTENIHKNYTVDGVGKTDINLPSITSLTQINRRGRGMKFKQTSSSASLSSIAGAATVYNDDYVQVNSVSFTVQPVDQNLNTSKKVINFGDSYTLRSTFADQIVASPAGSGLTFIGMRNATASTPSRKSEGRGGWTMSSYHTLKTDIFAPFMQPQAPYKYYGNTDYWINAVTNPNISGLTNYDWGNVDPAIRALYNGTTGLLISPATNDVMYINAESVFKRWDGSAWVTVTGLTFTFNFAKYRTLYSLDMPDIVHILMGTNDFTNATPANFDGLWSTYKSQMDATIASIKADNPSVKIIIGVPVSSGKQGGIGTYETERKKRGYWLLAKSIISTYSNREAEGLIIADYHSTVDREYGYDATDVVPFDGYTGSARERFMEDFVHLGADGFISQMGTIYYGAIQKARE
ncbi:SGNH/GDSL hydrolase family protein [Dyadobacter sp. Leaf189]|uniref:SGNH/GDSL hydrolase family protein n=1 Tax=Dyadobacter sp. Leaf189 TaxID=1736295 RepID=UPI0006FEF976|nr:SGNH/GDSL hydrolase family protein [Dyadobacter sp. Leaf189]KQS33977.1 hypothetical protein ASG33_08070 [Dyadobacter sp. Leaf189]